MVIAWCQDRCSFEEETGALEGVAKQVSVARDHALSSPPVDRVSMLVWGEFPVISRQTK
jgi:hypothetical protein